MSDTPFFWPRAKSAWPTPSNICHKCESPVLWGQLARVVNNQAEHVTCQTEKK